MWVRIRGVYIMRKKIKTQESTNLKFYYSDAIRTMMVNQL